MRIRLSKPRMDRGFFTIRSEEHTSELQSQSNLVCRLLLEKKQIHHIAYLFENSAIRHVSDTNSATAILHDLRCNVADAENAVFAMLFRDSELRRKMCNHRL